MARVTLALAWLWLAALAALQGAAEAKCVAELPKYEVLCSGKSPVECRAINADFCREVSDAPTAQPSPAPTLSVTPSVTPGPGEPSQPSPSPIVLDPNSKNAVEISRAGRLNVVFGVLGVAATLLAALLVRRRLVLAEPREGTAVVASPEIKSRHSLDLEKQSRHSLDLEKPDF